MLTPEQDNAQARERAFAQLDRMRSHWWWRPGWRPGRSYLTFHVTFAEAPEVHDLAAYYRQALSLPSLDPVPDPWLHLTMQGVGFTDDVADADLAAIVAAAEAECAVLEPFEITVGPADPDQEAVQLQVTPWAPLNRLRGAVRAAIATVSGAERVPGPVNRFTPHISAAYSNTDASAGPLRGHLSRADGRTATTTVRAVQLIDLNRDQQLYTWTTVADIRLGT